MLILIEDTERGLDVAKGIWGAFNSCLYINEDDVDMDDGTLDYMVRSCEQCNVVLIITIENVQWYKERYNHAFCIYCDNEEEYSESFIDRELSFDRAEPRDRLVGKIITYLKRKKLL